MKHRKNENRSHSAGRICTIKRGVSRLFTTVPMMSVPASELHQRVSDVLEPMPSAVGGRRLVLVVVVCLLVASAISTGRATNEVDDASVASQIVDPNDAGNDSTLATANSANAFLPEDYEAWPDLQDVELVINRQPFQSATSLGSVGWLEEGRVLMTSNRSDILFWDVATQNPIAKIPGGGINENIAAISRDGNFILASAAEGTKLYRWPGLEVVQDFAAAADYQVEGAYSRISTGSSRAISDDGQYVAVGFEETGNHWVLQVYDCETGEIVFHRRGPGMHALCWAPDGSYLAVGESRGIVIFLTPEGELIRPGIRLEPSQEIVSLDISRDGTLLAVCTRDSVGVYAINGRRQLWYHAAEISPEDRQTGRRETSHLRVAFNGDGSEVILSQYRRHDKFDLVAFDADTGDELRQKLVSSTWSDLLSVSPDGRQIAYEGINHTINLCEAATFEPTVVSSEAWNDSDISGDFHFPVALRAAPDGSRALTVCGGRLAMWDLVTGEMLCLNKLQGYCHDACWQGDGEWIATVRGSNRSAGIESSALLILDPSDGTVLEEVPIDDLWSGPVIVLEDERIIGCGHHHAYLFDAERNIVWQQQLSDDSNELSDIAISPDGETVAVCNRLMSGNSVPGQPFSRGTVFLLDVETGEQLHELITPTTPERITFSADGERLIASTNNHPVRRGSIQPLLQTWFVDSGELVVDELDAFINEEVANHTYTNYSDAKEVLVEHPLAVTQRLIVEGYMGVSPNRELLLIPKPIESHEEEEQHIPNWSQRLVLWDLEVDLERDPLLGTWILPGSLWDCEFLPDGRIVTLNENGTMYVLRRSQ